MVDIQVTNVKEFNDMVPAKEVPTLTYQCAFWPIPSLDTGERVHLATLFLRYYEGSSMEQFFNYLDEQSEVLVLYHDYRIVGFSTFQVFYFFWQGKKNRIVLSRDFVIEPEHWGQQTLLFSWASRLGELHRQTPDVPLYWMLTCSGHRTYSCLPSIGKNFFPQWQSPSCSELKALAHAIATKRFGTAFNPDNGIISLDRPRAHLNRAIATPTPLESEQACVTNFLTLNAQFLRGDELVCLCPLIEDNIQAKAMPYFTGVADEKSTPEQLPQSVTEPI